MSDLDRALDRERAELRPDPGTTVRHPTLRKGTVTSSSPFQVDGLPAVDVTGGSLKATNVVWMLVDQGRRLAFQAAAPRTGSNSNGTWWVLPSGLAVCTHVVSVPGGSTDGVVWTFPRAFAVTPVVSGGPRVSSNEIAVFTGTGSTGVTVRVRQVTDGTIGGTTRDVYVNAIGPA